MMISLLWWRVAVLLIIAVALTLPIRATGKSLHTRGARLQPLTQSEVNIFLGVKADLKFDKQLLRRKFTILKERRLKSRRRRSYGKSSKSSKTSKSSKSDTSRSRSKSSKSNSSSSKDSRSDSSRSRSSHTRNSSSNESGSRSISNDGSPSGDSPLKTSAGRTTTGHFSYSGHSEDFSVDDDFTFSWDERSDASSPHEDFRGSDITGFFAEADGPTFFMSHPDVGATGPVECRNYSPSMRIVANRDVVGLVSGDAVIAEATSAQAKALEFISAEDTCPEASNFLQRYAIAVIYYSLGGIFWINNKNYMSPGHECDWYGIACNEKKVITGLDLSTNFLFGSIPNEISLLSSLSNLDLSENSIFGSITPSIGSLKSLDSLFLHNNTLVGGIPENIYGIESLRRFHIDRNYLSGTISSSVGDLVAIEDMRIWKNHFEGVIPVEIALLTNIKKLYADSNIFTGGVDPFICQNFRKNNRFVEFTTDCLLEMKCDCCICF